MSASDRNWKAEGGEQQHSLVDRNLLAAQAGALATFRQAIKLARAVKVGRAPCATPPAPIHAAAAGSENGG